MADPYPIHDFSMESKWSAEVLEQGFTSIPNSLIAMRKKLELSTTEFFVLLCLEKHRWDNWNNPHPSLQTLSDLSGLSVSTVARATNKFERLGYLEKEYRFGNSVVYDMKPLVEELEYVIDQSRLNIPDNHR